VAKEKRTFAHNKNVHGHGIGVVHGEMGFEEYLGMIVAGDVDEYGEGETNVHEMDHTRTLKNSTDT
jgi:hypothetical protein